MDHKDIFNNIINTLYTLTKSKSISWTISVRKNNSIKFEFIGDDKTKYSIEYEWKFGNDGWTLYGGDLKMEGKENITLYKWKWDILSKLKDILLEDKDFSPDESNVIKNLESMANGISIIHQRDLKISDIVNSSDLK
jgi:hypothetical protein